ncbi:MAG: Adenylate cyclase, partial [Gemmatimonadetes bacterium]|nr:Adenylate cyclase [Gemmatimonadota bacterium]
MARSCACAALLCVFISAVGPAARAQRPPSAVGELDHAAWTIRDGAPSGVRALAQSADGMLWIGAATGLYQFDGVRFELIEPPTGVALPSLSVNTLLALPNGKLWIGYSQGGASLLARTRVVSYGERDGMPAGTVTAFAVDSAGNIWAATTTGLARFRDDRWQRIGPESGYPGGMTSDLLVDRRGTLWAAANAGVFVLARGDTRFTARAPSLDPTGSGAGMPREAPDGSVWGASMTLGLTRLSDAAGKPAPMRPEAEHLREAWGLLVDRNSNAWLMGRAGLVRGPLALRPDREPRARTHRPVSVTRVPVVGGSGPDALLEDREGNVWVGSNDGVERFRETKLTPVIFPGPITSPALVAGERGSVWVGSYSAYPLFSVGDSVVVHRGGPTDISCAYRDLSGGVWLGGPAGIWLAPPGGPSSDSRFSRVALPTEAGTGDVQAIARSLDGDLWVSMSVARAVFRQRRGVWSRFGGAPALPNQFASTIVTDSTGRTWLGYARNRVVLATGDSTRIYSEADGLQLGAVKAISVRGTRVWVGGESGVVVLVGERFQRVNATVRLRGITGIVETQDGDLWLNGAGGVTRIKSDQLRRALHDPEYPTRAERLDYHDGLNGQAPQTRPFPTAIEGTDGRLWFATETGVTWLDPTNIKRNRLPPPVQVRTLSAAGRRYSPDDRIVLPPGTSDLQIVYTASSLTMPDRVLFRYRLAGTDTAWQEPGSRREAFYTNLKPGSYHFQVIAANEDGVWNESGAMLDFTIPPTFTQSRWFLAVWGVLLTAVVWLIYQLRMRQIAAGLRARYQAALTERTRIAQELHDTLLQGFTGITIQLRAIQRILSRRPEEGVVALEAALTAADTTLRDARHTIWDMKAVELEGHNLSEALEVALRSMLTGAPLALNFTVRGNPRPLSPDLEIAALRIGREAVLNTLKHANARRVDVTVEYDAEFLRLEIRDDGRGMHSGAAEAAAADGHLGIVGMRARAHRTEGTIEIASEPGHGTIVR